MKIQDILSESEKSKVDEAPVSAIRQAGRGIGAKLAGMVGMKGTAAGLSGAKETGATARQLLVDLKGYAGKIGSKIGQMDASEVAAFVKSKGYPTTAFSGLSGALTKKQIDELLLKAVQDKARVSAKSTQGGGGGTRAAAAGGTGGGTAGGTRAAAGGTGGGTAGGTGGTGGTGGGKKTAQVPKQLSTAVSKLSKSEKTLLSGMLK